LGLNLADGEWEYRDGVYGGLPAEIKAEIPEVVLETPVMDINGVVKIPDSKAPGGFSLYKMTKSGALVEAAFFHIFDFKGTGFKWIAGNPDDALKDPNSLILTKGIADVYFPGQNPLGKTVILFNNVEFKVTGLVTDIPSNSDFPFIMFASYNTLDKAWPGFQNDWDNLGNNQCYVLLHNPNQKEQVENEIKAIHARHASKEVVENRIFKLQPLKDLHHDGRYGNFSHRVASREIIFALLCIGLFIIVIAGINYAILTMARSSLRMREVGVRKVFGSNRRMIIGQFITESFVLTLISMNIGILGTKLILSGAPAFIGIPKEYPVAFTGTALIFSILLLLLMSFLSGIFPAWVVSAIQPIDILKNKFIISKTGKIGFVRTMVVLQFTISLIMIISTMVVFKQLYYMQHMDPGFNKDLVVTVSLPGEDPILKDRFKTLMLKNTAVSAVSFASTDPSGSSNWTDVVRYENQVEKRTVTQLVAIDTSYLATYELHLVAGKNITEADSAHAILVNEQLVRELNFKNNEDAVDAEVNLFGDPNSKVAIRGVLKNYYYESVKSKIRPTFLIANPQWTRMAGIRILPGNKNDQHSTMQAILEFTQNTWESVYPGQLFEYSFLDDKVNAYYRNERLISQLFNSFSLLAVFIGCLGIFGLAFFTCNQKSKEIAVRKVNGASEKNILFILIRNYAIWICIAFVIACPIGWYAMRFWLMDFVNKTRMNWWIFALSGLIALAVAILTVMWQSYSAARKNPVDALKYE
jgi:putative ABC transport system permease protein